MHLFISSADIDECAKDNGGCEGNCDNHVGGFTCTCTEGKMLGWNGFSCFGEMKTTSLYY